MQSRIESLIEVTVNLIIGYIIGVVAQIALFPLFGIDIDLLQNMSIALIFLLLSIGRSYIIRRIWNNKSICKLKQRMANKGE